MLKNLKEKVFSEKINLYKENDSSGHLIGDDLLKEVSKALTNTFTKDDIILRLGGDEFAVYAINLLKKEDCAIKLSTLLNAIKSIKIRSIDTNLLSISIGCAIFNDNYEDFEQLYKNSDESLYESKKLGKGCYMINSHVH